MNGIQILNRSAMKKIMAGSSCTCTYNGCTSTLTQTDSGWTLTTCDGTWTGSGQYGGTVCGGACPADIK